MRIGTSLLLIAIGAILKFAITKHVNGVDLSTVGVVLMLVGVAGLAITMLTMSMRRRTDVVHRSDGGTTTIEPATQPEARY